MKKDKNQIKFVTAMAIIALITVIIVTLVILFLNRHQNDDKNTKQSNDTNTQNENKNIVQDNNKNTKQDNNKNTKQNNDKNTKQDNNKKTKKDNNNITQQTSDQKTDNDFSFKFLKMENKKTNLIYSPLSINYALQMLNDGAEGKTKTQINNVIGNTSLVKHKNIKDVLSLANALYIRDTFSKDVKNEYKNQLLNKYDAEIKFDPFKNANNMNSWIEDKTFGQIKKMLKDEIVSNPNTQMILINALAMDMSWENSFDEKNTHGGTFYLDNDKTMNATMMNKETKSDSVSYYKDDKITAISMDLKQYENEQMEFIAIMPNSNLSDYVNNFKTEKLEKITSNLTKASKTKNGLDISIPKFSFDYNLDLVNDLKALGITDAFDPNLADFSKMTNTNPFWVGGALHKANIDFTEKGVKAAAVTVMYLMDSAVMIDKEKPIEIKIDKPFMFVIKDKKTNEIWFVGTVYQPNSWEKDKTNYGYR